MSWRGLTGLVAIAVVLLVADAAPAAPKPVPGEQAAFTAVRKATRAGRLAPADAAADRREISRAVHLVRTLPLARSRYVEVALAQVGEIGSRLTAPRAVALFGQLRANDDWFAQHGAPAPSTDITDSDGVVYRFFSGQCFEFHPLANFGALNALVAAKDVAGTQRLADALVARGIPRAGGTTWEYYFRFEGGRPPWSSGMAQAVAAQAFSRAAQLVTSEASTYSAEARAAYLAIPGHLTTTVSAGPWIRLYSFRTVAVLNAQLQSILSLQTYAANTGDTAAGALATRMEEAAAATLPRFDTGYWTYYSLDGASSPLSYSQYVLQLLKKLEPADPRFTAARARFALYLRQPPAFKAANAPVGAVRFWLSKPASVIVTVGGGPTLRLFLEGGWHTLRLRGPKRAGTFAVHVTAVGPTGKSASFTALPLVRVTPGSRQTARARTSPAGATTPTAAVAPAFNAGVGIDDAGQAPQALSLGLGLVRMTIPWQPGETAPDPTLAASLQTLPAGTALVLELDAAQLPSDDSGRAQLAQFAAALAQQAPALRDLVLTPAPQLADAPQYADALAAVSGAVGAVRPDVAVGPAVDGSVAQPRKTVLSLAAELVHDGARPTVVAFRPAPQPGPGVWTAGAAWEVRSAFAKGLANAAPPVLIDAVAVPTTVPASELAAYTGGAPPTAGAVSPAAQASAYTLAIGEASCYTGVTGVILDRLVDDGAAPEPATGIYYAGGAAKPSAAAVAKEVSAIARGAVVCPGLSARVTPTVLTFPTQLGRTSAAAVTLGCSRDCLYLVSLLRSDGRPVVAARGSLAGNAPAQTITLPGRRLAPGRYRIDVRLVSRVDPGPATRRTSAWLTAGR